MGSYPLFAQTYFWPVWGPTWRCVAPAWLQSQHGPSWYMGTWVTEQDLENKHTCIFYFHPWEIDPEQPYQKQAPLKSKFRHYTNLHIMESKLRRALKDFNWGRMDEVFLVS